MKIVNSEQDTDKNYFSTPAKGKNPGKNIKKNYSNENDKLKTKMEKKTCK